MLDVYSEMSVAASTPFPSILQAYLSLVQHVNPGVTFYWYDTK
jgi:hypothetical protein